MRDTPVPFWVLLEDIHALCRGMQDQGYGLLRLIARHEAEDEATLERICTRIEEDFKGDAQEESARQLCQHLRTAAAACKQEKELCDMAESFAAAVLETMVVQDHIMGVDRIGG